MKASLSLTIVVIFAVIVATAVALSRQNTALIKECSNSNSAINPTTKGTVVGLNGEFTNKCDENGNLIDYFCANGRVDFINVYCGGKCVNGICPSFLECTLNSPSRRTIILRLDDVQDAWDTITINIINAILERNMSVTLGVIPADIGSDSLIKDYIINKINDNRISIAQHGTYHTSDEFAYLDGTQAYNLTKIGLDLLQINLHVRPVVFIPPNDIYNAAALDAFYHLGFRVVSSIDNEYRFDGKIILIGANTQIKPDLNNELTPVNKILDSCSYYLNLRKVCVILIHPQDLQNNDDFGLNSTKYTQFLGMLDGLKTLNADFGTFEQLLQCS